MRKCLELVSMEGLCDTTCEKPSPDFSSKLKKFYDTINTTNNNLQK